MAPSTDDRPIRLALFDAYALEEGAGLVLLELVRRLDRQRFHPVALVPRDGPLVSLLEAVGCHVDVMEPAAPLNGYGEQLPVAGPLTLCKAALSLGAYAVRVAEWLRRSEAEVLHCNQTRAAITAGPGARLAGVPVLWNVRIRERMPRHAVWLAGACSDTIVPLTACTFRGLAEEERLISRSRIIRNAVDLAQFHPGRDGETRAALGIPPDAPVILSVGCLVPRKGFDLLIRAMPHVLTQFASARLLIAGGNVDGLSDHRSELEHLARSLGVVGAIRLLGRRDDVPELLRTCDLFALASRHEGDPASVLEAMATGRPVVVTPAAAPAGEDGSNGVGLPEESPEALARAICRLLADRCLAGRLGASARATVEAHHDINAMVRAYEREWRRLAGR